MKVTFTVKNITDCMHEKLAAMPDMERFQVLSKWAFGDLKHCISQKIGSGQFRDRVELNGIIKRGGQPKAYKLEPRRGYKLATFTF